MGTILVIPIFIALGYSVVQAALLGSLGQMAVPWGGLGIGTALGAKLTGLATNELGAKTALLLAPLPATYGLFALFISGGQKAVRHHWLASLAAGGVLAAGLWGFSLVPGIELAGVLAGGASDYSLALLGTVGGSERAQGKDGCEVRFPRGEAPWRWS